QSGRFTLQLLDASTVLGFILCIVGGALLFVGWRRALRPLQGGTVARTSTKEQRAPFLIGIGVLIAVGGLTFTAQSLLITRTPWTDADNPVPRTAETVAVGQRVYSSYCLICHGPAGRGDGDLAPSLSRPPTD